jgi:hypothetical protein
MIDVEYIDSSGIYGKQCNTYDNVSKISIMCVKFAIYCTTPMYIKFSARGVVNDDEVGCGDAERLIWQLQ